MRSRPDSVINLDPIDRKKKKGLFGRFLITRRFRGKGMARTDEFGHYLFVGKQRSGKTVSAVWYADYLSKTYAAKKKKQVIVFSNLGFGRPVTKLTLPVLLSSLSYDPNIIYIFIIDEIQSYFPKDTKNKDTLDLIDFLTGEFSQLGKRQIFVLSTAQVYGRVNKNLREQCLYMVNCRRSKLTNKVVNEFIPGDDILCDDLGRWSGDPSRIYVHGLPESKFDTHRLILQ